MEPQPKLGPNRGNAGKGRPKGSVNKITASVKDAILRAAEAQPGGMVGYLTAQASENPVAFMSLLGRVLPMDVTNSDSSLRPVEIILVAASDQSND